MRVSEFDFVLPEDLIALRPAVPRDSARMLIVREGRIEHAVIRDLPNLLSRGDVLVVNDTKVLHARLRGIRAARNGASRDTPVEVLLCRRLSDCRYLSLARPAKRLRSGDRLLLGTSLVAQVVARRDGGEVELQFERKGAALDRAVLEQGEVPLPPYIQKHRAADARDDADYQTLFAGPEGSVAAPTAGLHFTPGLIDDLTRAGMSRETLTLHVGPGTFLPVSAENTDQHHMHSEWVSISENTAARLNDYRSAGGRLVAVGTTSLRALEAAAGEFGKIEPFVGDTDIFITPGYQFHTAEILLTNFHLPRSTLFMLACAFCGTDVMQSAYAEAIARRYRFYSYGDACLLFRSR